MTSLSILFGYFLVIFSATNFKVFGIDLISYFSQNGLHGEIHFMQSAEPNMVKVQAFLEATLQYPDQVWSWGVHSNPVDYSVVDPVERCDLNHVGPEVMSFDDDLGYLTLPGNESAVWEAKYNLTGENSLWGHSLVLYNQDTEVRICSTIATKTSDSEHIAEAKFRAGIAGSMYFRWLKNKNTFNSDLLIYSNLYHVMDSKRHFNGALFSEHAWKIYATDIFDQTTDRIEENCNVLQVVFDPQNFGAANAIGGIDLRVGKLNISQDIQKLNIRQTFADDKLHLLPIDLSGPSRKLYVVIYDHANDFLACAKIRELDSRVVKANINADGIKGEVTMFQRSQFEPTWMNFSITAAGGNLRKTFDYVQNIASYQIHDLPPSPAHSDQDYYCETTGSVFNPKNIESKNLPPPGFGTQDQYLLGDLSGKLHGRNRMEIHNYLIPDASNELNGVYWDIFMPLYGRHSIVNRGLVLNKFNRTDPQNVTETKLGCGTFSLYEVNKQYQLQIQTAQVLFRYPIVGKILFRQPKDQPWQDTTIIVEYLIHADGANLNNSDAHRWAISLNPPGKDFYSWQNRCISAGGPFNPYKVSFDMKSPGTTCGSDNSELCRMGDLARLGTLGIAGAKANAQRISRRIFTDSNLPLSGFSSIIGKSVVIYSDKGPVARGDRLACSIIGGVHRRKTVAKDWFANGGELTVKGKMEMVQQSEYELTNVEVNLKGLFENSGYHVHIAPIEGDLEFPCEQTTLYGHWNPRNVNPKSSPLPAMGSSEAYEMGDLSGKFGTLEGLKEYNAVYNDSLLPLFGYESIIGRSIIIHKKHKMVRWACSTLERGYAPNEAREIRAIASFHNPNGFAFGYMRMTQLIGVDGSQSDTVIEVKLRHPGHQDKNITRNHNWKIYVNPIGVDATVKSATRCVAGGYVWNPFYTQLADPLNDELYRQECGADNPLRCYVGDVSARLGTIDIGLDRFVKTDPNFPLEGDFSAIGRSIVIMAPERGDERYACANIEPDHDIVKYINLERPPRFVTAQFITDVRSVMGLPEWMLHIDSRTTQILHGGACIAFKLHFKGPKAHQLEQDFSRLLTVGKLDEPSLYIPGYYNDRRKKTVAYRVCSVNDPNEKNKKKKTKSRLPYLSNTTATLPNIVLIGMAICLRYIKI